MAKVLTNRNAIGLTDHQQGKSISTAHKVTSVPASASKEAGDTFMHSQKQSPLMRLPPELRNKIWRLLCFSPVGIVPRVVADYVPPSLTTDAQGKSICGTLNERYGYQFEDAQQTISTSSISDRFYTEPSHIYWKPKVLLDHLQDLQSRGAVPPSANGFERFLFNVHDVPVVYYRSRAGLVLDSGVAIAKTCKILQSEVSQVIYGDNTYVINYNQERYTTNPQYNKIYASGIDDGIPGKNFVLNEQQNNFLIDGMTSNTTEGLVSGEPHHSIWNGDLAHHCQREDPLVRFLYETGKRNAGLVKKLKFVGRFIERENRIGLRRKYWHSWGFDVLGLGWSLPIYVCILKESFHNLQILTLDIRGSLYRLNGQNGSCVHFGGNSRFFGMVSLNFVDARGNYFTKSSEDIVDDTLEILVGNLINLRVLKLEFGDCKNKVSGAEGLKLHWGKAVRWVEVVKDRAAKLSEGKNL